MAENQRYLALDVFRGMTVCFMIIVNTPGDWGHVYAPLLHAPWHGFTPTDLVFPSFLFAVGNAMAFAMHKYELQGSAAFWTKTVKRTVLIFLLGFLLHWFPFYNFRTSTWESLSEARILGVLARIALCYFFASIVLHYCSRKMAVLVSAVLLVGYWIILYVYGDANDPYSLAGYAGNALDIAVLGEKHLYHGEGVPFDPEGILSTLPAIVNVIGGYLVGDFIRKHGNSYETITKLMLAGAGLILLALTWHMTFPINKKIWTSSFVLLTVGIDMMMLAALIYGIEIQKKTRWTYFFVVFGKNPLFIYMLAGILVTILYMIPVGERSLPSWLTGSFFGSMFDPYTASLLFALLFMITCWAVGYVLDKKKIYIRV